MLFHVTKNNCIILLKTCCRSLKEPTITGVVFRQFHANLCACVHACGCAGVRASVRVDLRRTMGLPQPSSPTLQHHP